MSGSREENEADDNDDECRREIVPDVTPRQVRSERDEDEDHDDLRDRLDERAHVPLVLRVHAEPKAVHVPDDEPGEERPEVAAPPGRVGREVPDRDDRHDRDRRRLLPHAGPPVRDDEREEDAERDPEHGRDSQVLEEVEDRVGNGGIPARDDAGQHERQDGPGRVVQRRLGDRRLLDLLANADAREERDQDRRIRRGHHRADQETRRERDVEGDRRDRSGDERRHDDARHRQEPEADSDATEHADRKLEPAVEEDERHAERQQELRPRRVERHVDHVGDRRPEQGPGEEEHEHPWRPRRVGEELTDEAGDEHDAEREDDVLRRHPRRFSCTRAQAQSPGVTAGRQRRTMRRC